MFTKKRPKTDQLDQVIGQLLVKMVGVQPGTKEYADMLNQLTALYKLKEIHAPRPVSRDTMVIVFGNLVGIAMILGYEKANVVTSRAIAFVLKAR